MYSKGRVTQLYKDKGKSHKKNEDKKNQSIVVFLNAIGIKAYL